jgi:hypothetical protein
MAPGDPVGPGANVPPLLTVTAPTTPLPASVAPLLIATAELAIEPFTMSVPAVIVVGPLYVFAAVSTKEPAPIFSSGRGPLSSEITPACVALRSSPAAAWCCC